MNKWLIKRSEEAIVIYAYTLQCGTYYKKGFWTD